MRCATLKIVWSHACVGRYRLSRLRQQSPHRHIKSLRITPFNTCQYLLNCRFGNHRTVSAEFDHRNIFISPTFDAPIPIYLYITPKAACRSSTRTGRHHPGSRVPFSRAEDRFLLCGLSRQNENYKQAGLSII